jgi:heme/copper-type cytochrome/quinol oxidase subunit 2
VYPFRKISTNNHRVRLITTQLINRVRASLRDGALQQGAMGSTRLLVFALVVVVVVVAVVSYSPLSSFSSVSTYKPISGMYNPIEITSCI